MDIILTNKQLNFLLNEQKIAVQPDYYKKPMQGDYLGKGGEFERQHFKTFNPFYNSSNITKSKQLSLLDEAMESLRSGMTSIAGAAIQAFIASWGWGAIANEVAWGALLVYDIYKATTGDPNYLNLIIDLIGILFAGMGGGVIGPLIKSVGSGAGKSLPAVINLMKQSSVWKTISPYLQNLSKYLSRFVEIISEGMRYIATNTKLGAFFKGLLNGIVNFLKNIVNNIVKIFVGVPNVVLKKTGQEMVKKGVAPTVARGTVRAAGGTAAAGAILGGVEGVSYVKNKSDEKKVKQQIAQRGGFKVSSKSQQRIDAELAKNKQSTQDGIPSFESTSKPKYKAGFDVKKVTDEKDPLKALEYELNYIEPTSDDNTPTVRGDVKSNNDL